MHSAGHREFGGIRPECKDPPQWRLHLAHPYPQGRLSQVRYRINRDHKAVQTSQSFDDHAAAIRWARLLDRVGPAEAERVLAAQLGAVADTITLKVWLHRYVDRLGKSVDEETKRKYRRMIDRDIVPFFNGEHLPVDGVTPELDAAWVESLEIEFDNAPKTIRNKHSLLCAALGATARQRPTPLFRGTRGPRPSCRSARRARSTI
ncbi:hypothetical protein [Nocardia gipuzkoensis]